MTESRWEMRIGSPVMATDGEYGPLQKVLMDPQQERVVALIMRQHGLPSHPAIVVPEEAIAEATDSEVRLKISLSEMDLLPKYKPGKGLAVEGRVYEVDVEAFAMRGAHGVRASTPSAAQRPHVSEIQPAQPARKCEALQLQAGQKVFCRDGHVGKVSLMLLEPGGRVMGLVVHAGHLPGQDLIVPAAWVQGVDRGSVHLSAMTHDLPNLPEYHLDSDLADETSRTLWADEMLRDTAHKGIHVTAEDGIVALRGHVITRMHRKMAEDAARLVPGVLGVQNHLVADEDLLIDIGRILGHDERTRLERISVGARSGFIMLSGKVGSAAVREAAGELAASFPKVRGVANFLNAPNVAVDALEGQLLEPTIGAEVFATDLPVGHVERVIINPHNRRVTAFVLHGRFPDPRHANDRGLPDEKPQTDRRVMVPIFSARYETDTSVDLAVSSLETARNHDFEPAEFVSPPRDWQPPFPYQWGDVLFQREIENAPKT